MNMPYTILNPARGGSVPVSMYPQLGCSEEPDCDCGCGGGDCDEPPAPCCPTTTIIIRETRVEGDGAGLYHTFAELRAITDPEVPHTYYHLRNTSFDQVYYYDIADETSEENLPNVVVTWQDKRLKLIGSVESNYD